MSGKIFVDGMIVKEGRFGTRLSLKLVELLPFLENHNKEGWVNIEIKKSLTGKMYAELDTWQPNRNQQSQPSESIPGLDNPGQPPSRNDHRF